MFRFLVTQSLRNRLMVLAASLVLVLLGIFSASRLPVDVFPDLNKPTVTIMTESEGLAPPEVEQLVSFPIETQMNGVPGVTRVRSVSGEDSRSSMSSSTGVPTSIATASRSPSGFLWSERSCRRTPCRKSGRSAPSWGRSCLWR